MLRMSMLWMPPLETGRRVMVVGTGIAIIWAPDSAGHPTRPMTGPWCTAGTEPTPMKTLKFYLIVSILGAGHSIPAALAKDRMADGQRGAESLRDAHDAHDAPAAGT